MPALTVPRHLREGMATYPDARGTAWLAALPDTVADLARRWSLQVEEPFEPGGHSAWVAPVTTPDGTGCVLKLARPHDEGEHEPDALRLWDGDGAVALLAADAGAGALLLERCRPGTVLRERPEPEQDVVIAGLLPRLWVSPPAGHPFRPLQEMCDAWAAGFESARAGGLARDLDPDLARDGIRLLRTLPATAERQVVLCTDLHAGNVLASGREPWLAIDPKPYLGDPAYDVVQHLLNCRARLETDPVGTARRMAGLAELDPERVIAWLLARCVQMAPIWPWGAGVARELATARRGRPPGPG